MPSVYDRFNLVSDFSLAGDQERAIGELVEGLDRGDKHQVLLGVTGSGKTFTMAQTIAKVNRPTLVMVHNKTLAAQLYQEFRRFFPDNAVEYFVSYYDYYQPEAYVPATDSYIEKEATINDEIDRMRLSATRSTSSRRSIRSPAKRCASTTRSLCTRSPISWRRATGQTVRSRRSKRSSRGGAASSSPKGGCSRRSGCTSGRCSTSR